MGNPAAGNVFGAGRLREPEPTPFAPTMPLPPPPAGLVSDIVAGPALAAPSPIKPIVAENPMMSESEWRDKYRQDMEARNKAPSGIITQAVETPVTPAPITAPIAAPAPAPRQKRQKPKAGGESDPYETWKQLGKPGGSFENWKKGQ